MVKPNHSTEEATIKKITTGNFKNKKTTFSPVAFKCFFAAFECVCLESGLRAIKQAMAENRNVVRNEDVWKILPQLIMDTM